MTRIVRSVQFHREDGIDTDQYLTREWLVTNGLGGYASGTIGGVATRRYHGLLIAALPAPLGRMLLLSHLTERIRLPEGTTVDLWGEERVSNILNVFGADYLREFRLERGLPVWTYDIDGTIVEKRVLMPHGQNTVYISYRLLEGQPSVRLKLQPMLHFRGHDDSVSTPLPHPVTLTIIDERYEFSAGGKWPSLRMRLDGEQVAFTSEPKEIREALYRIERSRGYHHEGPLWSPGYFRANLTCERPVTVVASTEQWATMEALTMDEALTSENCRLEKLISLAHPVAREGFGAELVIAADQFLIEPAGRAADAAWAHASGDDVRTVIAGYHWFTDWGRDTMISLEGLTLTTGRPHEAGYLLRTFAHYVRDGLIPNHFPEGGQEGLYHTADATLWYFHALDRYLQATGDRDTLRGLLPTLKDIVHHHIKGTHFNIGVDPNDGLLRQGAEGYQLTWMDAKVGDWVVTPRRGKAVEINALWYNALRLMEQWCREEGEEELSNDLGRRADQAYESFNRRYWYAEGGYLYDVVDGEGGDDPACRPNQIFAISLPHPVLDRERWLPVVTTVENRLLTPMGLRSLAPGHPDYKPVYSGDLRSRDAAYHQGTVWGWLIGPFIDAWLKVHPNDFATARGFLEGFSDHLGEACIGQISEICDAEAPYTPRGCIAQAWSVAEVLRCWVKTAGG